MKTVQVTFQIRDEDNEVDFVEALKEKFGVVDCEDPGLAEEYVLNAIVGIV